MAATESRNEGDIESGLRPDNREESTKAPPKARVDDEEEGEDEKAAYRYLLDVLDQAEDKTVSGAAKFGMGVELVVVLGLTAALACTLTLHDMKHSRLWGLRMWQYVMMAITLFAGLSIVRCLTMLFFSFLYTCSLGVHRDVGYFLREMKRSIDVTLWFSGVLFLWYVWFRRRVRHLDGELSVVVAHQLTRFLIAACLGAVLWVGKNALFFWLEADLHYRKLADRITRTIRQLHVLQLLHKFGVWVFLHHAKSKANPKDALTEEYIKRLKEEGDNICKQLLLVKRERVPVWILRRLCEEYKNQIVKEPLPISKEVMQDPDKLMEQAIKLFREMKGIKSDTICDDDEVSFSEVIERYKVDPEDLELFFRSISGEKVKPNIKPEILQHRLTKRRSGSSSISNAIKETFRGQPKRARAGSSLSTQITPNTEECDLRIGRDEFVSWAVVAYRNCWGLQSTLKSSEEIIVKLNRVMIVFVLILALIIWLLLSEIVDTAQIALLFSPLIAVKFIFSESTKNMFDGLIFALAMHPFSPGDRVVINAMELLVTEISILTTTFYNYQTGEELVYPNSELSTTQIINLENNPDQRDQLEFFIDKSTPLEDIRDLEIRIQMSLDERVDAFKTKVVKAEMGLGNIKMIVHFNYVGSYLTSKLKAYHRSEMLSTIMLLLKTMKPSQQAKDSKPNEEKEKDSTKPNQDKEKDSKSGEETEKDSKSGKEKEKDPEKDAKPYIVDITLGRRVKKAKHLEVIRSAVKESLKGDYGKDFKVVFSYVTDNKVRVIFWVWKVDKQLISVKKLDEHCSLIFGFLQSEKCLQVTQVKVQPTACIVEIIAGDVGDKAKVKSELERYLRTNYYPYDFDVTEVKGGKSLYEIHAWIQFPYNMEEKRELDMEQVMTKESKLELKELKGILTINVQIRKQFLDSTNSTNACPIRADSDVTT